MNPVVTAHPEIKGLSDWRPLARGGFAAVWQARQDSLGRQVAVKVDFRPLDEDKQRRRFLREAGAAGRLSGHPGIVTVHDAGILPDDRPYLVLELCPGGSLSAWLTPEKRPPVSRVRDVGVRIADALAAAHARGVIHRDVKPANILIDAYGHAGLTDFGLAAMPEPGSEPSVTMEALTPAYAPPEMFHSHPATEFGDVYSLAATLYALLAGHPPRWPSDGHTPTLPELIELHGEPAAALPQVPQPLMDVLAGALAPEASERPTAAQFRDQLAAVDLGPEATVDRRALALSGAPGGSGPSPVSDPNGRALTAGAAAGSGDAPVDRTPGGAGGAASGSGRSSVARPPGNAGRVGATAPCSWPCCCWWWPWWPAGSSTSGSPGGRAGRSPCRHPGGARHRGQRRRPELGSPRAPRRRRPRARHRRPRCRTVSSAARRSVTNRLPGRARVLGRTAERRGRPRAWPPRSSAPTRTRTRPSSPSSCPRRRARSPSWRTTR